ncbi:MAG TPA: ABC transporter ATP-binding protein, partial [Desulfobaccales bacterium]|nr:ABC transporter ATP-binding protein [Desulfobaccales bacterium]
MAEIVITGLNKVYDDGTVAVQDFTLTVADGEFLVLVGPSGCGKSTVLRCVAGLEHPTGGTIAVGGRAINDLPPQARDLSMVFQTYALYPHMTVFENLAFGLKMRHRPRAEIQRRVAAVAEQLGLGRHLNKKPRELSGGERQRVALGRAIVRQPQAFLMDEPLSNLDAALRVKMRTELLKLQRELKATFLYVTHDQTEALTMGDRVAVLHQGRLQQVAPPQELYEHPVNRMVAGFIGSPAMNFIKARLSWRGDGFWLELGGRTLALPEGYLTRR